jgi:protein-L-isoaspartate(D-aspartate) O-methyltransferase
MLRRIPSLTSGIKHAHAAVRGLKRCSLSPIAGLVLAAGLASPQVQDRFASERQSMVREIERTQLAVAGETGQRALDPKVMAVMSKVERHRFVHAELAAEAYDNRPLPIGHGQTISQPYIVALMTDLMRPNRGDRVLELGTGSGYQAAVLAELVKQVYTIEIIEPLGKQAAQRLAELGYRNVQVKVADGYYGWPEHAPFDSIIVTAAASHVPLPLVRQLKPGGRMVMPVGVSFLTQYLMLIEKQADGSVTTRQILPVAFVPLTGSH